MHKSDFPNSLEEFQRRLDANDLLYYPISGTGLMFSNHMKSCDILIRKCTELDEPIAEAFRQEQARLLTLKVASIAECYELPQNKAINISRIAIQKAIFRLGLTRHRLKDYLSPAWLESNFFSFIA